MIMLLASPGSYAAIFLLLALTGLGLPLPEEAAVVAAGVLAGTGQLDPAWALACCLLGIVAGDSILYGIGRVFGHRVLREHRHWARLVTPEREGRMERILLDHGVKMFFLVRFLVGFRPAFYLAAGILRMPLRRFLLIDLGCTSVVVSTFFFLAYRYGPTVCLWLRETGIIASLTVVLVVLSGAAAWHYRRRAVAPPCQVEPPMVRAEMPKRAA